MAVTDQTISLYAGNRMRVRFTVTDSDGSGAKNLTGSVVRFAATKVSSSTGKVLVATPVIDHASSDPSSQIVLFDAAGGIVDVTLVQADTQSLLGDYYFELEVELSGSTVVVATGTLTVLPNVVNS